MDAVTTNDQVTPATTPGAVTVEIKSPLIVADPSLEAKKEPTPEEKMCEALSGYAEFLKFENGILSVNHPEYKALLKPKILKMGDLVRRGNILTGLNGGVSKPDSQSAALNACLATVQVGFEKLDLDLLKVADENLLIGLYEAVTSYNGFFRKTPLSFVL